jgi:hypothetical protein
VFLALILTIAQLSFAEERYYDRLFEDGRLDVTIALGFQQKEKNILSRDEFNTFRDVNKLDELLLGCGECGFAEQRARHGQKRYFAKFGYRGRVIEARVNVLFSVEGVEMAWLKSEFIRALGRDDVIVYLGHSRYGRGIPDFGTPLGAAGFIFSKDPVQGWLGFEKGYFARDKYQIVMLNACQTRKDFRAVFRERVWEKNPGDLALILTEDDNWFSDNPPTTLALLRGLMAAAPAKELLEELNWAAKSYREEYAHEEIERNLFTADGLFDATYDRKPKPRRVEPREPFRGIPF